jgi:hypothetical protein
VRERDRERERERESIDHSLLTLRAESNDDHLLHASSEESSCHCCYRSCVCWVRVNDGKRRRGFVEGEELGFVRDEDIDVARGRVGRKMKKEGREGGREGVRKGKRKRKRKK